MKPRKHILFTFDYELFLGADSGNVSDCLLKPTELVVSSLELYGLKGIFFVDTLYLLKLKQVAQSNPKANADLSAIETQLVNLLKRGHWIYPHVHPHWEQATYDAQNNSWQLCDLKHYCISSVTDSLRNQYFENSIQLISAWQQLARVNYTIDAYRAGGWSIQPFSDFSPHFMKHGIAYDFSVIPGSKITSDVVNYDFSSIRTDSIYRFTSDVNQPDANGKFIEVPISAIDPAGFAFYKNIQDKFLWRTSEGRSIGKGKSIAINVSASTSIGEMASIELLTGAKVNSYVAYARKHNYLQFISHPKMLSQHNLKCLHEFLSTIAKDCTFESEWKKSVNELLTISR